MLFTSNVRRWFSEVFNNYSKWKEKLQEIWVKVIKHATYYKLNVDFYEIVLNYLVTSKTMTLEKYHLLLLILCKINNIFKTFYPFGINNKT